MDFIKDLSCSVLANFIFWLCMGFVVWMIIRLKYKRLLRFFGLQKNRSISVYLSNLWNATTERPVGYLVSGHEFRVTETINNLFGKTSFLLPDLVRGLVDSVWIGKEITKDITVSPISTDQLRFSNMIVVGSTVRNSVRRHYLNVYTPYLAIVGEQAATNLSTESLSQGVEILKGLRKGKVIDGPYKFAIVEKIIDEEHGTVIFMCFGLRGDGSWLAVEYLARHWEELYKQYGDKPFAKCLGFRNPHLWAETYEEPLELGSFPE